PVLSFAVRGKINTYEFDNGGQTYHRHGRTVEFLPLVRLRVLPVCNKGSGKTSFGIRHGRVIYHRQKWNSRIFLPFFDQAEKTSLLRATAGIRDCYHPPCPIS
ncbi:hypothetical protein HMPREF9554_01525, partial [Treponema phagedenis F0421]